MPMMKSARLVYVPAIAIFLAAAATAVGGGEGDGPPSAGISEIAVESDYAVSGDEIRGKVILSEVGASESRVIIYLERWEADIPAALPQPRRGEGKTAVKREIASAAAAGKREVPFAVPTKDMLLGRIQLRAEYLQTEGKAAAVRSLAYSKPIAVGLRRRLDLSGEWQVAKVELLSCPIRGQPKDWKLPEVKAVRLPGSLDPFFTPHFRGWVALQRTFAWQAAADLQPRFLHVGRASDSAAVAVDGQAIGETCPLEDKDTSLSHWGEFHATRMWGDAMAGAQGLPLRLAVADQTPAAPATFPLPQPLPASGKAEIVLKIRGASGMFREKPAYGIFGDLFLEMTPAIYVRGIAMATDKQGEKRQFKFSVTCRNDSGREFKGTLRAVYGQYQGDGPYAGPCPPYAVDEKPVTLPPGDSAVEVAREETPRFATCRVAFLLLDARGRALDLACRDFHTVTVEIRERREIWLNNERFILKGRGSFAHDANQRWQLRVNGVNAIRGVNDPETANSLYRDQLLSSAGPLLASCERCTFWNPRDTSNIDRAVRGLLKRLADCPGIIQWEATNELFGEPEEARVAIQEAFHKYDPYRRPVLATKSGGEWEAEVKDGRVAGMDIVGCQYLLSREAVDSALAAITEQPLICSEVNWNDGTFLNQNMWEIWLSKGLAGALLFDYSGNSTDQGVPLFPPPNEEKDWQVIREWNRNMMQDLVASARLQAEGRVKLSVANRMPYTLRSLRLRLHHFGALAAPDLPPGAGVEMLLPPAASLPRPDRLALLAEYETHGGLKHVAILTPPVQAEKP
ncbi:MAG: hypothetical protein N3A66_00085 [Planctomycetota bacterium]|nr:hypothetical protein [Planctomycetota bacterium]